MVCSSGLHGSCTPAHLSLHSAVHPGVSPSLICRDPPPAVLEELQPVDSWVGGVGTGTARGPSIAGQRAQGASSAARTALPDSLPAPAGCPPLQPAQPSLCEPLPLFLRLSLGGQCTRGQNREPRSPGGGRARLATARLGLKGHHPRWGPRPPLTGPTHRERKVPPVPPHGVRRDDGLG